MTSYKDKNIVEPRDNLNTVHAKRLLSSKAFPSYMKSIKIRERSGEMTLPTMICVKNEKNIDYSPMLNHYMQL